MANRREPTDQALDEVADQRAAGLSWEAVAKKTRRAAAADATAGENPRRPCPCGSGKRYKACHGAGDDVIVTRPFAGLAAECELVAMREFLPSATAPLPTRDGQQATVATVKPVQPLFLP